MNIPQKNWLEWSVFAVGLLLVVGVLAYLAYDAVTLGEAPPDVSVELGTPEQRSDHFVVPVSVANDGDQTAEGVHVEVVLEQGGEEQHADFEIAFLPRGATHEGWVAFRTDPRAADRLEAHVLGYETP